MRTLIALSVFLAIAFIALIIYTLTQLKDRISKKEFTESTNDMASLGYTFFEEIAIDASIPYGSTPLLKLKNVYLRFPKRGERYTYGFNDYIVEDFEFKNSTIPPRLVIWLEKPKDEEIKEDKNTQPSTL